MIRITGADLAWVYQKGRSYTVGVNLGKTQTVGLNGSGDYGVATFRFNDGYKLESSGHVYIRVGDEITKRSTVDCYILKEASSNWYHGVRRKTSVVIEGMIQDVTTEYEAESKKIIDEAMHHVETSFASNEQLIRMFSNGHNHFSDLGFARFAQRRDGHHSIVTPGCAGIPELGASHIGDKTWGECCRLAMLMTGFRRREFDALKDEELRLNVLDQLACIALAATGFMFQWNLEPYDSICYPATVLGTMQDCEDNAVAVVSSFNWLTQSRGTGASLKPESMELVLHRHLRRMGKMMHMVAGYVDVSIANPEAIDPNSISGHAWAVLYLNDDYRPDQRTRIYVIEGTDPFYIHRSTNDDERDVELARRLYGGVLNVSNEAYPGATYDSPKLQPLHRYKTVDVEFGPRSSEFVGRNGPKFRVGLTIDEFVSGRFDRAPIAPEALQKRVIDRWGDFVLAPDFPVASRLFHTFPKLVDLYKLRPSDYKRIPDDVEPTTAMDAMSAFDIKTKLHGAPGYIQGYPIELPFSTILVVPAAKSHVSR